MDAECSIYNWQDLDRKYSLKSRNQAELAEKLIEKIGIKKTLSEIDGEYSFAYRNGKTTVLCRDLIGVYPMYYSTKPFKFDFQKKNLKGDVYELNPREIIEFDGKNISKIKRKFFSIEPEHKKTRKILLRELEGLITNAVAKRIPDEKFGILFSGGVDSTLIALICRKLGVDFTCYTVALDAPGLQPAGDLIYSKRIAKRLGLKIKVKMVKLPEVESYIQKIVPLVEDHDVTKVGVALPVFIGCEMAKQDGLNFIFSGVGSEEIFAGYERHLLSKDVNKECIKGLKMMYQRDTYRDYVCAKANKVSIMVPFLDKQLVDYALKIPAKHKLGRKQNKIILREAAEAIGLPGEFAQRKKRAAQYGSNMHKGIQKLARMNGFKLKKEYLRQFI
jgi:asparagine synthetase B (glutamine-hydrolysing)